MDELRQKPTVHRRNDLQTRQQEYKTYLEELKKEYTTDEDGNKIRVYPLSEPLFAMAESNNEEAYKKTLQHAWETIKDVLWEEDVYELLRKKEMHTTILWRIIEDLVKKEEQKNI